MRMWRALRRRPMAVPVLAVVLAFAVVCPVMASSGVPEAQGCHGGSESAPAPDSDRVSACCSSVTVPKVVAPAPSPGGVLPGFGVMVAAPAAGVTPPVVPNTGPPVFLACSSLLI